MNLLVPAISMLTICATPIAAQDWAVGGYDAVGFVSGEISPGQRDISTLWNGKFWHFASEDNRAKFESNPQQFAPAFNGLCPVSLAQGQQFYGDPQFYAIVGDKLYLARSRAAQQMLERSPDDVLRAANSAWATLN